MSVESGQVVRDQARDDSFFNTEPAVLRGAILSGIGIATTVLVMTGVLSPEQKQILEDNALTIAAAIIAILPILQAIWTRFAVYSPRSAARTAVNNAALPAGSPPVLKSPP